MHARRGSAPTADAHSPADVAREATAHPAVRALARSGFAANGVVHLLLGGIILAIAFGGEGDADQSGALRAIAAAPLGFAVLWVIAVALAALALWRVCEGMLVRVRELQDWGPRVSAWGQAVVYGALAVIAASVALGARPDSDRTAAETTRTLLSMPGGAVVVVVVGLAIAGAGVAFVVNGVRRSFRKKVRLPRGRAGSAYSALGVVGYAGKGAALGIVGVLLIVAAVNADPSSAGGLDQAVDGLLAMPYGRALTVVVALGLLGYGVFTVLRTRYARL